MKKGSLLYFVFLLNLFLIFSAVLYGQDEEESREPVDHNIGFIFNLAGPLLKIDESGDGIQSGLGIKYWLNRKMALRGLFDLYYLNDSTLSTSDLTVGLAASLEYHFTEGKVSPYTGAVAGTRISTGTVNNLVLYFGGLLGVEVELRVSRTPIREALIRLSAEKLVTIIPRAGARVADINLNDFKALIEMRLILERGAVRLAALKANQDQIHRLEKLNIKVKQADYEDVSTMLNYDVQFHKIIREIASNFYLSDYLSIVMNQFIRIEKIISYKPAVFQADLPKFILALKRKDPDQTEKLIEHHLENIVKRVKNYIKTI